MDQREGPWWLKKLPSFVRSFYEMGMWISVTVAVVSPIFMKDSIQESLDVLSRNALLSSEAFLVPYKEIFQFIEDIVSVRVNYAITSGDKALADQLVHAGMAGSFLTGLLAAGLATILGVIPSVLQLLANPGKANDMDLYPGCSIISDSRASILPYWLVEVWSIPGAQLGMVLNGFMLGALEIPTTGWIMAISLAMTPLVWFTSVGSSDNPLLLLSLAEFSGAWVYPFLSILYLASPLGSALRKNTGVSLSLFKLRKSIVNSFVSTSASLDDDGEHKLELDLPAMESGKNNNTPQRNEGGVEELINENDVNGLAKNESAEPTDELSVRDLLKDGLKVMLIDVVVQLCVSLTNYLALANDGSVAYQLTALQSQLPTYGMAYTYGIAIIFKIVGPIFISLRGYKQFALLARAYIVIALLMVPLIVGSTVPFNEGLAFSSGANACQYAGTNECVPFFTNVFGQNGKGGTFSLQFTYRIFAYASSAESVFIIVRAILLTVVDFNYMVKCTVVAVSMYIAAIVVATQVQSFAHEAISYIIAMYVPFITLIILFTVRIEVLIRRMKRGIWSSVKSSGSTRVL